MTGVQVLITVLMLSGATILIRFLPFFLFPSGKEIPHAVLYLGKVLPAAVMGMLVVYCFKDVSLLSWSYGMPEAIGCLFVIISYLKWKNLLISIGGGTAFYMILVQVIFG
ncbi:MAG: branched-chain amino acid transporter AzlD [Ruminococcaceae bacterium]|nr:branched-chain amino acid transporter AzlD [Oscillospiraceae bacterium]